MQHRKTLQFLNEECSLIFDEISVDLALQIDYNGFDSSFKECESLFENIKFQILKNNQIVFNSNIDNPLDLDYVLSQKIFNIIKNELYLSEIESKQYISDCIDFLNSKNTSKMPPELLISINLINRNVQLNLQELENMNIKK